MPTYEYACKSCGQHLDVVQSFHDDPLTECPACGGYLRKVFSAAGIIFKGSGWHVKDYATSGSSGNGTGDDSGDSNGGASKDDSSGSSTDKTTSDASSSTAASA